MKPAPERRSPERDRAALARERRGRRSEEERSRTRQQNRQRLRARPDRHKEIRRRWVALLSVLTVVAGVYLLYFSSMLGVQEVSVLGARSVPADQIRAVAAVRTARSCAATSVG